MAVSLKQVNKLQNMHYHKQFGHVTKWFKIYPEVSCYALPINIVCTNNISLFVRSSNFHASRSLKGKQI